MEIKVLGPGCPKCKKLYEEATKAVSASGVADVSVSKVERIGEIAAHGVMMTPALVIDGVVKAQGQVPDARQIATWIVEAQAEK